ncbi:hypothetical protein ACQP1P_04835 [Dactylosporangium sp. CA-052675]|uniref:hypothetical protein n=1 Tax=Dactylosporangium sp. CA-052675 TaxID=3239927 RepID=UPI003D93C37E
MKLYLTQERHTLLSALCASNAPARSVSPTVSLQWQKSVLAASSVAPAPVAVPAAVVPAALVPAALVPAARVARATGSVRTDLTDLTVRVTEAEVRIDDTEISTTLLDERGIQVQGTTGFSAKHDMTAPKPNGGVRGIPPRGRPV